MIKQEIGQICPGKGDADLGKWAKNKARERENKY